MMPLSNVIERTVPVSMFNNGMAEKVFDDVKRNGTKVVMKNNSSECVLMSPEEYMRLNDEYNDFKLLALAHKRMENFDPSKLLTEEEVFQSLGITQEELDKQQEIKNTPYFLTSNSLLNASRQSGNSSKPEDLNLLLSSLELKGRLAFDKPYSELETGITFIFNLA